MRLRGLPALALGISLGALVFSPALRTPLFMDDYLHRAMVDGTSVGRRGPLDLYNLFSHAERAAAMQKGALPWWTDPRFAVSFMRPLSSALLFVDHRLLGDMPLLLHLHSFFWWAVAALGARALFRRMLSPRAAAFALFSFALSRAHAAPIGWLANREELVALALGAWALYFHVRAREDGRARDWLSAALLFSMAMLAGEYALCVGGYVVAFELARRGDGAGRRALSLAAFAVPAGAYVVIRAALGYGATGSGFYREPLSDLAPFLASAPRRFAALALDGWLDADADVWSGDTHWAWLVLAFVAGAAVVLVAFLRARAELGDAERRATAWMLGGSLLSLAPLLSVAPSIRLIGASTLGASAVVGAILDRAFHPSAAAPRTRGVELGGLAAVALGFLHLVHAPLTAFVASSATRESAIEFSHRMAQIRKKLPDPEGDTVVILRAAWQTTLFGPFAVDPRGVPPRAWRVLTQTLGHVLVLRDDARTLEIVVPKDQSLFPFGPDDLFRQEDDALRAGDVIEVPGMRVTVVDADARGTHRVKYELDRPLSDGSLVWMVENRDGVAEAVLPDVGFGKPFDP